jgi:hypothetical protein
LSLKARLGMKVGSHGPESGPLGSDLSLMGMITRQDSEKARVDEEGETA